MTTTTKKKEANIFFCFWPLDLREFGGCLFHLYFIATISYSAAPKTIKVHGMTHLWKFHLISEINGVFNTSRTRDNIILIKNASRIITFLSIWPQIRKLTDT